MKTIDNLEELLEAIKSGEVINDKYPNIITVDNDHVSLYYNDPTADEEDWTNFSENCVFTMHPAKLLEELLDHVGLKWKAV